MEAHWVITKYPPFLFSTLIYLYSPLLWLFLSPSRSRKTPSFVLELRRVLRKTHGHGFENRGGGASRLEAFVLDDFKSSHQLSSVGCHVCSAARNARAQHQPIRLRYVSCSLSVFPLYPSYLLYLSFALLGFL
jgi:hypothetical protein